MDREEFINEVEYLLGELNDAKSALNEALRVALNGSGEYGLLDDGDRAVIGKAIDDAKRAADILLDGVSDLEYVAIDLDREPV